MRLFTIVFSPTGGTRKAASIIAGELSGDLTDINLMNADFKGKALSSEDLALIAVPAFSGRVPTIAAERISSLRGNSALAILLSSFGNRAVDDTLIELRDLAKQAGFRPFAAIEAVTQHSLLPRYGAGRPDARDRKDLKAFAAKIREKLLSGESLEGELEVPGNHPYRERRPSDIHPTSGKGCSSCLSCVFVCPVGAISMEQPERTDPKRCIGCMACVSVCPQKTRKLREKDRKTLEEHLKEACAGRSENRLYL